MNTSINTLPAPKFLTLLLLFTCFSDHALASSTTPSSHYWEWWIGALALGGITVLFWLVIHSPLGVSSSWHRIVTWREERNLHKLNQPAQAANLDKIHQAILSATLEQFGEQSTPPLTHDAKLSPTQTPQPFLERKRTHWTAHITFLSMTAVGAMISAYFAGGIELQFSLGDEYQRLFGQGWMGWVFLFVGGLLVGFGTRLGTGCTSGHGLSGVSRFQTASILGTAAFFGSAIAFSLVVEYFL